MASVVETFFKILFGPRTRGYVCIATLEAGMKKGTFRERYFSWPEQVEDMLEWITQYTPTHNVYFCPQLLQRPHRVKESVLPVTAAWADLDNCDPSNMLVPPTIVVESSPLRYQAYWTFDNPLEPEKAEDISKRIAYFHASQGADRSGWDLTQLLRVPGTYNRKEDIGEARVAIRHLGRELYRVEDFDKYPKVIPDVDPDEFPYPGEEVLSKSGEEILIKHEDDLPPTARYYFDNIPDKEAKEGWSGPLWSLQMVCFEHDLSREETFLIARDSACNKYRRDGKPMHYLWTEVCRAWTRHQENNKLLGPEIERKTQLLDDNERAIANSLNTFVETYSAWARSLGDAAPQYHLAGGLIILSTLLSGNVRLPTSFGTLKPNLWFMILADTTLTRKSTAMDIAMDLIEEVDADTILATDGSIEGLMMGLSTRPGKPSIFLRDEFSGLLESMTKKDYMAGMAETLTKLYDGKLQKRVLKKETISVQDPCLVIFAGGIKNKVTSLLTSEHVSSGFVPRFVFVTAESDLQAVKPLGPPSQRDMSGRQDILSRMRKMQAKFFSDTRLETVNGQLVMKEPRKYDASLTPEAWERYNVLEADMMRDGLHSRAPELLTPTYDRLCKSALKTAVLLAAADADPETGTVEVTLAYLLKAISYLELWRDYTNEVVNNVGVGQDERLFRNIVGSVERTPGITRSTIMQRYHLTARTADGIFQTLEQRGLVTRQRKGQAEILFPFKSKIVVSGKELK